MIDTITHTLPSLSQWFTAGILPQLKSDDPQLAISHI